MDVRQIHGIHAIGLDLRRQHRVARPQLDEVTDAREMNRKRGAPAPCSEYGDGRNIASFFRGLSSVSPSA
jgi:hypothetical protein